MHAEVKVWPFTQMISYTGESMRSLRKYWDHEIFKNLLHI